MTLRELIDLTYSLMRAGLPRRQAITTAADWLQR